MGSRGGRAFGALASDGFDRHRKSSSARHPGTSLALVAPAVPAYQADHLVASPPVTTLFIVILVLGAGAAIIAQLVWWLSGRSESGHELPPIVVPIHPQFARRMEAQPIVSAPAPVAAAVAATAVAPTAAAAESLPTPPVVQPAPALRTAPEALPALATPTDEPSTELPNETVRFVRPGDEALQLLPARFEVVSGMNQPQVIRFVRVPGQPAEMIIGREAASSPQQVTLTSSTVSRRHARVTWSDGRWLVSNLSRTNPVVINDHALAEFEGPRPLLDGDRIELGDVVLRFCTS
jgi:hypothetical protein